MNKAKITKYAIFSAILLIAVISVWVKISAESPRSQAAAAAGGLPYQIGLTKAVIVKCVTTGYPPICVGGTLCTTLDPARCNLYSDVSGTPSGGMGSNALFSNVAIAQAGLTPGGQLIAGGMSPVLMDQGVLASAGGCYGCVAKSGFSDKIFNWLDRYIIAGFRSK